MMEWTSWKRIAGGALLALIAGAEPSAAYEPVVVAQGYPADGCMTRREARATVLSGRAVRLRSVVGLAQDAAKGEMINAELCWRGGQIIYVITVLSEGGKVVYVTVDATNGQLIGTR